LAGLGWGLYSGASGGELALVTISMEMSNPFMHALHMLREMGFDKSLLAIVNKGLFVISFFITRMILGTYYYWKTYNTPSSEMVVKVGGFLLLIVSYYWFYLIMKMLIRTLSKEKKTKTE